MCAVRSGMVSSVACMGDDGERFAMRDLRDTRAEERGRELAEWAGPGREEGGGERVSSMEPGLG